MRWNCDGGVNLGMCFFTKNRCEGQLHSVYLFLLVRCFQKIYWKYILLKVCIKRTDVIHCKENNLLPV